MLPREIYEKAIKLFENQNASPSSYGSNAQWVQWIHRGFAAAVANEEKKTNIYGIIAIVVGWMVFPNGKIQLTTPFGGYAKQ